MQQLFLCILIFLLFFAVCYLFGKSVAVRYHWELLFAETLCIGFFLYFASFQVLALIMVFTKQKLHVLAHTWLVVLCLLIATAIATLYQERKKQPQKKKTFVFASMGTGAKAACAVMAAAIVCECAAGLLLQRSIGWDFAYYIGNMTTSVATDTMYLYDGSSGMPLSHIDFRYALSGFYMNTAWISQLTGVSALLLQKYVMGVFDILLADAVLYSFAMEVFHKDRKKSGLLVSAVILMTVFWDVYDTSAQFLLLRGYEAKAYCANVVLPMTVYLLYRIWKDERSMCSWAKLFIVAFASVAVSMSSILLVPAAIVIMVLAHLLVTKAWNAAFIRRTVYCLLPNICYLLVYFAYTKGWLMVSTM